MQEYFLHAVVFNGAIQAASSKKRGLKAAGRYRTRKVVFLSRKVVTQLPIVLYNSHILKTNSIFAFAASKDGGCDAGHFLELA
jgi:hypothetical protein